MKMKKKKDLEDHLNIILFAVLAIGVLGWLIWSIYGAFYLPQKDNSKVITFQVTGITNSQNASTLVQLHWECIKYCMSQYTGGTSELTNCWEQCALLGKEGCSK